MALRKLPAKYLHFVLPFLISIFMSCLVSGIATWHSLGFVPNLFQSWMSAWAFSWVIAFPVLLVVLPVARRLALLIVEHPQIAPEKS